MPFILAVLAIVAAVLLAQYLRTSKAPLLKAVRGAGGGPGDPRIAAAAMMYAVAGDQAPVSKEQEQMILGLLVKRMGASGAAAEHGLKLARRAASLEGDLTSRLHQLKDPIVAQCSAAEKRELIDMLRLVAGVQAERLGPVRDGIGRLSATILDD